MCIPIEASRAREFMKTFPKQRDVLRGNGGGIPNESAPTQWHGAAGKTKYTHRENGEDGNGTSSNEI